MRHLGRLDSGRITSTIKGDAMQVTINASTYELTREGIEGDLATRTPEPVTTYWVDVAGRRFPVKQVLSAATGLTNRDFDSGRAQSVLRRLGFDVQSSAPGARGRVPGSTRAFAGVEWGLATSPGGYEEAPLASSICPAARTVSARPSARGRLTRP